MTTKLFWISLVVYSTQILRLCSVPMHTYCCPNQKHQQQLYEMDCNQESFRWCCEFFLQALGSVGNFGRQKAAKNLVSWFSSTVGISTTSLKQKIEAQFAKFGAGKVPVPTVIVRTLIIFSRIFAFFILHRLVSFSFTPSLRS